MSNPLDRLPEESDAKYQLRQAGYRISELMAQVSAGLLREIGLEGDVLDLRAEKEVYYAARESLANEIRKGLKQRGYWAPERPSDLITAIFQALDQKSSRNTEPCSFSLGLGGVPCSVCQTDLDAHAARERKVKG